MSELKSVRLVFVGTATLQGGKVGELWATEAMALAAVDAEALRAASSPFGKGKRASNVGGVYEFEARLDGGGKPIEIRREDGRFRGQLDTDAVAAMALRERGVRARDENKRAEEKARKTGPANDLLDQLARVVAAARFQDQEAVIAGFTTEVRKRAMDIYRKGRKA